MKSQIIIIIITNISKFYISFISSCLFTFSIVLFYLDNLRLFNYKIIRFLQIFSFIGMLTMTIYLVYYNIILTDIIYYVKDNNDTNNTSGNITINKDTGKVIGQGLNQIGLGITMAGIGTAVGKAVAKSSMPPLQKTGLIVGASIFGGLSNLRSNAISKNTITIENIISNNNNNNNSYNKLVDNSTISPLQESLLYGELMSYMCLNIVYILIIQLIFKLYFKDKINLNFSKLLTSDINTNMEFYINKIIKLNKKMSFIWIWLAIIIIMYVLIIDAYSLYRTSVNIENLINVHISLNSNIINNISFINMFNCSIQDILLWLKIINLISIIALILLILQIKLKFNYNKNINNIYVWSTIIIIGLTLAFSGYVYQDLHTNINSYVSI